MMEWNDGMRTWNGMNWNEEMNLYVMHEWNEVKTVILKNGICLIHKPPCIFHIVHTTVRFTEILTGPVVRVHVVALFYYITCRSVSRHNDSQCSTCFDYYVFSILKHVVSQIDK